MKILLVNKYWYIKGGAERVVFATKKVLEDAGHEVEIFGMKHPKNIFENKYFIDNIDYGNTKGLRKIIVGIKSIYNWDAKNKFADLIDKFKPDIVHFHNIYHQLSFSLLDVVKEKKIPAVMTLHDYKMISPNYNLFNNGKIFEQSCGSNYYKCILNNCMGNFGQSVLATCEAYLRKWKKWNHNVKMYISSSNFLKEKFLSVGFVEKIEVVSNPLVDFSTENILVGGKNVLYMGRLSEEKGVELVLKVAKQLLDIKFQIVGDGPLKKYLQTVIEKENIKNVEILGYQSSDILHNTLEKARILIMPSQWYENCPLSVLEAHAAGKVILASNLGGLVEMVPKDMLVDHKNIEQWVSMVQNWYKKSDEELKKIGIELRARVFNENDLSTYYKRIIKLYEKVVKSL
ncbi:MAG: glycosyltransferase [Candidatus Magasanikbacteria bacterium]